MNNSEHVIAVSIQVRKWIALGLMMVLPTLAVGREGEEGHEIPGTTTVALDELKGQALHEELVRTAMAFDVFNQRCRGVSASTQASQVNRLFVEKYRMTVNNFLRELMQVDGRELEQKIERSVNQTVMGLGGCQKARADGMEQRFKENFRTLIEKARQSPWYPVRP
ncbi:hypothetical protein [Hydrogenovibrio halophilus]|uniref:hypothetical protein n=1 Tax=Hydrogenovibrio halophilus TaxID=373391 RepID=UPI00035F453B|nr:hypothetical protein [Hydrogenovibrio halophilus]